MVQGLWHNGGVQADEEAKFILCCVIFGLSAVGTGALDSHARAKKHDDWVKS